MTTINRDEWLHALKEAGLGGGDVVEDPEAQTAKQLAQLWGCSVDAARNKIAKLMALGLAKKVTIRGGGQNHPMSAFKLVKTQ